MLIVQKARLVYIVVVSSISVRLLHIVCQASICYCHMREYPLFPAFLFFQPSSGAVVIFTSRCLIIEDL